MRPLIFVLFTLNFNSIASTSVAPSTKYYLDAPDGASKFWLGARFESREGNKILGFDTHYWNTDYDQHKLATELTVLGTRGFFLLAYGDEQALLALYGGPSFGIDYKTIQIKSYEYNDVDVFPGVIAGTKINLGAINFFLEGSYNFLSEFDGIYIDAGLGIPL